MWSLLVELGIIDWKPISLLRDNQSHVNIARNMVFHAQIEHIETHYHYIHENVQVKEIYLVLTC
jgi:hypothetical protein